MSAIGYASLPIAISMRGLSQKIESELQRPMENASKKAGKALADGLSTGVDKAAAEVEKARKREKKAAEEVLESEKKLGNLRDKAEQQAKAMEAAEAKLASVRASGEAKIRQAEENFNRLRDSGKATTAQLEIAEKRLEAARHSASAGAADKERLLDSAKQKHIASTNALADAEQRHSTLKNRAAESSENVIAATRRYDDAVVSVTNRSRLWGQAMSELNTPLDGLTSKLGGFAALAAGGLGVAGVATFFQETVRSGMELETVMGSLQAVTGSTTETMAQVSAKARELGNDSTLAGTSAASATDAMLALAKGGFSVQDAMDAAKGSIQLAGAAQIDAGQAAEIQIAAINSFGLAASDAGRVADVLTNAANNSATGVTELAEALKYAAPTAATLGVSLEDANTMVGLFANNGVKGSEAGTALRSALLSMTAPSKEAAKAMDELGLEAFDAEGKFVGLSNVSEQLKNAQERMGESAFTAAAANAFGREAIGFATTAAKGGAAAFDELRASMDRQGSAGETAGAKLAGMNGAIDRFGNSLADVQLLIYELISPELTKWIDGAGQALSVLGSAFSALGNLIKEYPGLFGSIAAGVKTAALAFALFKGVPLLFTAIRTAVLAMNGALLSNPLTAIAVAIAAVVAAVHYFFTETDTGKALWQGFVDSLKVGWAWLTTQLAPVWDGIVAAWQVAWGWIKDHLGPVWDVTVSGLKSGWQWVKESFAPIWDLVVNYAQKAWGNFETYILPIWEGLITGLKAGWEWVKGAFAFIWSVVADGWSKDWERITSVVGWAKDLITGWWDLLVNGDFTGNLASALGIEEDSFIVSVVFAIRDALSDLKSAWGEVVTAISGGDDGYGALASLIGVGGAEFVMGVITKVQEGFNLLGSAWEELKAAFGGGDWGYGALAELIGERQAQLVVDVLDKVGTAIRSIGPAWEELKAAFGGGDWGYGGLSALIGEEKAKQVVDAVALVGDTFRNLKTAWEELKAAFNGEESGASGLSQLIGEENAQKVIDAVESIKTRLEEFKAFLVEAWDSYIKPKVDEFKQAWTDLKDKLQPVIDDLKEKFQELWDKIGVFLFKLWEPLLKPALLTIVAILTGPLVIAFTTVAAVVGTFIAVVGSVAYVMISLPIWVRDAVNAVKEWWNDLVARTREKFNETGQVIKNWYDQNVATLPGKVQTAIQSAADWFAQLPSKIKNIFSNAGSWLTDAGKNIIRGLISGVTSMAGFVSDAIRSVVPDVVERHVPGLQFGGQIPGFESGGRLPLTGPGTNMVDGFLGVNAQGMPIARVDTGEWVINGRSSQIYNRELAAINAGTFPKLPGYADGGKIGVSASELLEFFKGKKVNGVQASRSLQGAPYVFGGMNWGDCSSTHSHAAFMLAGRQNAMSSRFATGNALQAFNSLSSAGWRSGKGDPKTTYTVGWFNGGPGGGHMTGSVAGTNVEMGGGNGGGAIGGGAASPFGGSFTNWAHYPLSPVASDATITSTSENGVTFTSPSTHKTTTVQWGKANELWEAAKKGVGLYDTGGILAHGGVAVNLSGKPEAILTHNQWGIFAKIGDALQKLVPSWQSVANSVTQGVKNFGFHFGGDWLAQIDIVWDAEKGLAETRKEVLQDAANLEAAERELAEARASGDAEKIAQAEEKVTAAREEAEKAALKIEAAERTVAAARIKAAGDMAQQFFQAIADVAKQIEGIFGEVARMAALVEKTREEISKLHQQQVLLRIEGVKAANDLKLAELDVAKARWEGMIAVAKAEDKLAKARKGHLTLTTTGVDGLSRSVDRFRETGTKTVEAMGATFIANSKEVQQAEWELAIARAKAKLVDLEAQNRAQLASLAVTEATLAQVHAAALLEAHTVKLQEQTKYLYGMSSSQAQGAGGFIGGIGKAAGGIGGIIGALAAGGAALATGNPLGLVAAITAGLGGIRDLVGGIGSIRANKDDFKDAWNSADGKGKLGLGLGIAGGVLGAGVGIAGTLHTGNPEWGKAGAELGNAFTGATWGAMNDYAKAHIEAAERNSKVNIEKLQLEQASALAKLNADKALINAKQIINTEAIKAEIQVAELNAAILSAEGENEKKALIEAAKVAEKRRDELLAAAQKTNNLLGSGTTGKIQPPPAFPSTPGGASVPPPSRPSAGSGSGISGRTGGSTNQVINIDLGSAEAIPVGKVKQMLEELDKRVEGVEIRISQVEQKRPTGRDYFKARR